ncbi:hypothetical protein D3C76_1817150 [compost metagenome]
MTYGLPAFPGEAHGAFEGVAHLVVVALASVGEKTSDLMQGREQDRVWLRETGPFGRQTPETTKP